MDLSTPILFHRSCFTLKIISCLVIITNRIHHPKFGLPEVGFLMLKLSQQSSSTMTLHQTKQAQLEALVELTIQEKAYQSIIPHFSCNDQRRLNKKRHKILKKWDKIKRMNSKKTLLMSISMGLSQMSTWVLSFKPLGTTQIRVMIIWIWLMNLPKPIHKISSKIK